MKYRLKDVVGTLDFSELQKISNDLDKGGIHLKKLVKDEIKKNEKLHDKHCSVCANKIHPEDMNNYTLVFGPESFKKKASFCAIDCMEYFLHNLKKIKSGGEFVNHITNGDEAYAKKRSD